MNAAPSGAAEFRTAAELHAGLAKLRAVFTGREPPEARTGVVPIGGNRLMVRGSTAPAVLNTFVARPSGLLVPAAAVPAPLDTVVTYLTGDELFDVTPSPMWTLDQLRRLSFPDVLAFVAHSLAPYRRPGVRSQQVDRELAPQWLVGDALVRATNQLRDPARRLVAPQAMYVMAKLAAFHSPDAVLPGVEAGQPVGAYFGALAAADASYVQPTTADEVVDADVGPFSLQLMANQHLNAPGDEAHLMARFVRRWLELPHIHAADPRVLDLEAVFAEVTGVPLQDVLAAGVTLWAAALSSGPRLHPTVLAGLGWRPERIEAVLQFFAVDVLRLRGLLRREARQHGLVWAISTIEQYPVVRLDDGSLLVLDMKLLGSRLFGGLTLFDITAPLEARGDRSAKKLAKQVRGCVAHLAEVYALEVLTSLTSSGTACRRVFDDDALKAAYRRKGRRIADAAVDYGDAWVVVEVTTTTLKRESVAAVSPQWLSDDLDKLVGEVEQIDHTIAALREDEAKLTGGPVVPGRVFYPLLVVADGFPVNPMSTEWLRQRVQRAGLLGGPRIAPLQIVDTVELEMLEALAQHGGPGLRDVLADKGRAHLYRDSMRNYLLNESGHDLRRPQRVDDLISKAAEPARRAAQGAAA